MEALTILISCTDSVGLVSGISNVLAAENLNIIAMREFVDEANNSFFARIACGNLTSNHLLLKENLLRFLPANAIVNIVSAEQPTAAILVTKEYHCLAEILVKNQFENLGASVKCVIGNYPDLQNVTAQFGIPYFFIDHKEKSKEQFEEEVKAIIDKFEVDYIVLAKFMRILSFDFVQHYPRKIINIHHSFLPAFIGANPYRQAFERGVKIIGATAHFVTDQLDQGPIIAQQITHIDHNFGLKEMVKAGKEVEKRVLLEALDLVFEHRVFISGNKTVVFK
ncbi:formyltetrahydrofolate deformylase [Pedobacter sp. UYP30]|uniref:formyltetrahydrofolate deformylase n=1 Tax=Pedobacter sp. UYP30 TaxID=1756400 RepID=UPI00339721F7